MGDGGQRLHEWAMGSDDECNRRYLEEAVASLGAVIAGRITYDTLGPVVGRGRPDGTLIERAKGARERLDDQEAFAHLRRAARSSGRKLSEVARAVAAGQPLPRGRTRPTPAQTEQPERVWAAPAGRRLFDS